MPYRIINELRGNGIRPLKAVAEKLGMPVTTAHSKMERVRDNIKGTLLLDFERLGYPERIFFIVSLKDKKDREKAAEYFHRCRHVNTLHKIDHSSDFLFEAVFRNAFECSTFIDEINACFRMKINYFKVIRPMKQEKFELR